VENWRLKVERIMAKLKNYVIATRPWSFSMSLISVTVGTLLAAENGPILWGWFLMAAVGAIFLHAATNVINDYFDTRYQVDQPDSPTAKYRPQPLLSGMLDTGQLLAEALLLLALSSIIGLVIAFQRSQLVLWIGLIGFFGSIFYTAGPIKYKYRALGELAVFLMWGPLMIEGAYVVQRQALSWKALLISIPIGIWVALVLLANNIRDIEYDARLNIRTLSIMLGSHQSLLLFAGLMLLVYLYTLGMIAAGVLGVWGLLVLLSLPMAIRLLKTFWEKIPDMADASTANVETFFGALLIVALILNWIIPL
jgi:1,4-dihydroxy-2-naphthoate octaprenyltransferase